MAVQMLFQSDLGGSPLPQIFNTFDPASQAEGSGKARVGGQAAAAYDYGKSLVRGTIEHRDEIDGLIREQAEHWRLERMPVVDRNILRLAVYEFLYETDVPKLVVLDEAIELAKRFGSEQSGRFVNGLLDGLLKRHEFPGRMK
jgi:N utilization substance protein B